MVLGGGGGGEGDLCQKISVILFLLLGGGMLPKFSDYAHWSWRRDAQIFIFAQWSWLLLVGPGGVMLTGPGGVLLKFSFLFTGPGGVMPKIPFMLTGPGGVVLKF